MDSLRLFELNKKCYQQERNNLNTKLKESEELIHQENFFFLTINHSFCFRKNNDLNIRLEQFHGFHIKQSNQDYQIKIDNLTKQLQETEM